MANNKKKKRDAKTIVLRILAIILLIVGLLLIFNKQIRNQIVIHNQNQAMGQVTRKNIEQNQKKKGMFDFNKVKEVDFNQVVSSARKKDAYVIGALAIPDVNMHLPICLGMSDAAMTTGGGTMREDQKMGQGNYPLAGHYMTSKGVLFSPLENVKKGQRVYLTNMKKVYIYKIYMKKIVNPYAVYLVDNTVKPIVTLITCADGGVNRWAIRGNLIKEEKATKNNLKVFNLKS